MVPTTEYEITIRSILYQKVTSHKRLSHKWQFLMLLPPSQIRTTLCTTKHWRWSPVWRQRLFLTCFLPYHIFKWSILPSLMPTKEPVFFIVIVYICSWKHQWPSQSTRVYIWNNYRPISAWHRYIDCHLFIFIHKNCVWCVWDQTSLCNFIQPIFKFMKIEVIT